MSAGHLRSREGVAGEFSPQIDALFAAWDKDGSPGCVLAVCHRNEIVHQRGYGVANIEDDVPFTANTVLRLGSTSKHLCATCILLLEQRGQLSLGDDIREYVPEFPDLGATITIRHLLTMTSGLWDGLNMVLFAGLDTSIPFGRDQLLPLDLAQRELMFKPGDDCSYSNTNYSLLTLVVERLSRMSLADFMATELFAPLQMTSSKLTTNMEQVIPGKAKGYEPSPDGGYAASYMMVEMDGAGGVDSTLNDMLKWFRNYRDDQVFGPDYRQRLEAENCLNDGRLMAYRNGIEVKNYRGVEVVRHSGGMPGYLCDFVFFPEPDLGIVLLTNTFEPSLLQLPDRIADIVIADEFEQAPDTMRVAAGERTNLIGTYASRDDNMLVEFADDDGDLVAYVLGELNPLLERGDWLYSRKNQIAMRVVDKTAAQLLFRFGCEEPRTLSRIPDPRVQSCDVRDALSDYVGKYVCDEIAEAQEVSLDEGTLTVSIASPLRELVWDRLTPIGTDFFAAIIDDEPSCTNVPVCFERDSDKQVTAMIYSINRCRGVRFRKA